MNEDSCSLKEFSIGDVLEKIPKQKQIQKSDFEDFGAFPIIDQGKNFIAGYTNNKDLLYNGKLPVIIFGDHTQIFKFINFPFAIGADGTKILRPNEDLFDIIYFYYALKSLDLRDYGYQRHFKYLKERKINWVEKSIQNKISSILLQFDNFIKLNQQKIEVLKRISFASYNQWFINKDHISKIALEKKNSKLGEIPANWHVKKLGDILELAYGKGLPKKIRIFGSIPVFGSSGIIGYHNKWLIKGPGIIVGRKGNVGSVHWSEKDFYPIDTVFYIKSEISMYYLYFNLKHQNFINSHAAVPGLNRNEAYLLPILIPDNTTLKEFEELIKPIFQQIQILIEKNEYLEEIRDLIGRFVISEKHYMELIENNYAD